MARITPTQLGTSEHGVKNCNPDPEDLLGILVSATNPDGTAYTLPVEGAVTMGVPGAFAYAAGTAATTVDVPAGARVRSVAVVAGASAATLMIAGGATITVPAGLSFTEQLIGDTALGADVVIGGTPASYFVAWTT